VIPVADPRRGHGVQAPPPQDPKKGQLYEKRVNFGEKRHKKVVRLTIEKMFSKKSQGLPMNEFWIRH